MVRDVTNDGPPFRISRDGTWWHGDQKIQRHELVRLFASILTRDTDGSYWLSNPAERCRVNVEDVPYVIEAASFSGDTVTMASSLGEKVVLSKEHPLVMRGGVPYVMVRGGCEGRVSTSVYYELVKHGERRGGSLWLRSGASSFLLGGIDEDG
ncbi:MAG: DUF1285 domain-containing protein [Bdellovibrionales bacterium]